MADDLPQMPWDSPDPGVNPSTDHDAGRVQSGAVKGGQPWNLEKIAGRGETGGVDPGYQAYSGGLDRDFPGVPPDRGDAYARARQGLTGPSKEGTAWQQMVGRFKEFWGPQPYAITAQGGGVRGAGNLAPTGFSPDPSTGTGVIFAHAGQSEIAPEPGPTREIEGNVDVEALMRGMGADAPRLVHIVHHVTHTVPEGNAWWTTGRILVPVGPTTPIQIAPANPKRTRLTIVNEDSANSVDLFAFPGVLGTGTAAGFPLPFGASLDMRHTREVYALATTAAVTIAFKAEFSERPTAGGGGEQ